MFSGVHLGVSDHKLDFMRLRYMTYALCALIVLAALGGLMTKGVRFGIDFSGGTVIEARLPSLPNLAAIRAELTDSGLKDVFLQEAGTAQDLMIKVNQTDETSGDAPLVLKKIKNILGPDVDYRRIESVGPKMGRELVTNSLWAVLWAMLAMLVYIWIRFEWKFGLCAIIALVHDALGVFSLYTLFGLEFNVTAIVAILITIGYSINDTVVIYDRIRENLTRYKKEPFASVLNVSINQTLSRTILTSGSTLIALLALYFLGGDAIATYSFPILVGVLLGTFSSIFLAAPLLLSLGFKIEPDKKLSEYDNLIQVPRRDA